MRTRRYRTLPLRRWLALALIVTFVVPAVTTAMVAYAVVRLPQVTRFQAADRLRGDVERWHDPAWQAEMRDDFAPHGVDFVLIEDGREVYRSTADPVAGGHAGRIVQRYDLSGTGPSRTIFVYADLNPWESERGRIWIVPVVALSMLAITLGGIAWFLGRTVVQPLGATGAAARQVADGDLDVALPPSRVREVAEVNSAFEAMGTGLRASLEQQAAIEQERRLFIGAIVHDLRTPLFSLRGSLEGIATGIADTPEKRVRYIAVAQEKADALERLVGDLFDFTRFEYLDQTPSSEPLDFAALLKRVVEGVRPRAEAKGVSVMVEADAPCSAEGDPHLLTRAVENLLDNALRFTPAGGTVRVTCHTTPGRVTFSIADTGPGIPPHDLPHLFTPLYRGETSRNRRTGGAGLGLTIARRILLAHGGDLSAASQRAGGAVFTGTLPSTDPSPRKGGEHG
jgi:signal transduction histidine kinase